MALNGQFNDGKTAQSRQVSVSLGISGIQIRDAQGLLIASWRDEDLRLDDPVPGEKTVRLICVQDPGARLKIEDGAELLPRIKGRHKHKSHGKVVAWLMTSLLVLGGGIYFLPNLARLAAHALPTSVERQLGAPFGEGMIKHWDVCRDKEGERVLNLLVSRLSQGLPPEQRPEKVIVVDESMTNALALPGGSIVLFSGLIESADTADEVAGVLAHEMTHISERHTTSAMIRAVGVGALATLISSDAGGVGSTATTLAMTMAYSRDDEAEADRGGVSLLSKAGIASAGFTDFFRKLPNEDMMSMIPEWLSTHPDNANRIREIEALPNPGPFTPALTNKEWEGLQGICDSTGDVGA